MTFKKIRVLSLTGVLVAALCCAGAKASDIAGAEPDYTGTWLRVEKFAGGTPLSVDEKAVLKLTKDTFKSESRGVPGAECENSGSVKTEGETMVWTVKQSTCASIINVGSVVTQTYSLSDDNNRLTLINKEWGYEYKEVLARQ